MKITVRQVETETGREWRAWVPIARNFEDKYLYLGDVRDGGDTVRMIGGQAFWHRSERPGLAVTREVFSEDISLVVDSPGVPCNVEMPCRPELAACTDPNVAVPREQMKPCPFCGSVYPGALDGFTEIGGAICCFCNNCLACGPESLDEADAVQRWNKRPPSKDYDPYRCTCGHREADHKGGGPDLAYGEAGPCTKCECASYQEESA